LTAAAVSIQNFYSVPALDWGLPAWYSVALAWYSAAVLAEYWAGWALDSASVPA
jgi:hypothetical protein